MPNEETIQTKEKMVHISKHAYFIDVICEGVTKNTFLHENSAC